ncbi:uncharacterized protein LOC125656007 [Ostrea edulis]|uniref:uncharacterized protein LOC125656007 n=1 Tax=Ostrea edulis TaxID=37623 RepID=UPI0024AF6309|nr:uncharacterized protein LOC125656007 [Ostrea edulis]
MTMFCPVNGQTKFTDPQGDLSFVTGYKISVSNDGVNFGEEEDMYIFNSTYQEFAVVDGKIEFKLKENYCFIDGSPYFNQTTSSSNDCRMCIPEKNAFDWSTSLKPECRISIANPTTSSQLQLGSGAIAGIVVGGVCFLMVVTGIIVWKYKQKRPKRFTSRVSMDGLGSETTTATTK